MNTKHLLMFVSIAVLAGAIISMTTSGIVAAQTSGNGASPTTASNGSLIDAIPAGNGMTDDEDEEEDEDECNEDDELAASAVESTANDADEAGDVDENDEEDEDEGEEEDEEDEKNGAISTSASGNSSLGAEQEDEDDAEDEDNMAFEPCIFTSVIDNPYLPLSKYGGKTLTFAGNSTEDGQSVKITEVWTVLVNTTEVADVETLTVKVSEYEEGELVQEALLFYAQGIDGVVYFFGEDVVDYENGVAVENDDESWTVGDDAAVPGIAMPATPAVGMGFAYQSVNVPGLSHELSEVKSLNETISVEFGSFTAIQVTDYDFDDGKTSQEFYASGVGLVKEVEDDEELELISIS